jgi:hypothetical protein
MKPQRMPMSSEAELVINVWESIADDLPAQKRADIAREMLYAFADFGFTAADLAAIVDDYPELRYAFEEVFEPMEEDDEVFEDD